jgi:hypothetical protein
MQFTEVLESANIYRDDKARRRLNTAPDTIADITLREIELGVTIERLEALNVPVYQYGTQITIHGTFPEDIRLDSLNKYVLGYKSLFVNANGSLGVKYVAVDGAKKQLLADIARWSKNKWHISIDSQGLTAYRVFYTASVDNHDKQDCIDCYNSTRDDLYIGNKRAAALQFGGYAVILNIGAIYQQNLWPLITWLTGIESQTEYDKLEADYKAERAIKDAQYDREVKAKAELKAIELSNARANFKAPDNWQPFKGKIEKIGTYARIYDTYSNGIALQVIKVVKRGAFLCSNTKNFVDFKFINWQPDKYHKCGYGTIDGWIIQDSVKTVPREPKLEPKSITDSEVKGEVSIVHNQAKNGIEISFKAKPDPSTIAKLKSLGFRWSYEGKLWWKRYSPESMDKAQSEFYIPC